MTAATMHDAPPLVANLLDRLDNIEARPSGRSWRARCPIEHNPEIPATAGLLITHARDGRVLLQCQGGCDVEDVLDHVGLKPGDLYPGGLPDRDEYALTGADEKEVLAADAEQLPRAIRAIDAPPPKPIQWIVNDVFTEGEIGLLVGDGGSFKSTAAINMACAIAGGYPVWGRHQAQRRSALIVSAEDSLDVVMMRINAFVAGHEWDRTRVLENVHLFTTTDVTLATASWQQHIINEAKRIDAGMIVLDPFAELINGDENSNSEIRPIVKFLRSLGRQTGAAVIVVHHAGKQGQDKRALDRIRGASALPSASRSILFFDYQPNGAGVVVEHLKMSRSPRLDRFILARHVDADSVNRALWFKATLAHVDVKAANESRAEAFVLKLITDAPRTHTTASLRKFGATEKLRAEDIGTALNALYQTGQISFEPGPRGSKKWYAFARPDAQPDQLELPDGQ